MSKRLRGCTLTAIMSASLAGAVAAPAQAETLADALALAYESNPNLLAQRASQRALDETYVQARSGWRPTLNLNVVDTYQESRTPRAGRGLSIDTNGDGVPDSVGAGIRENYLGSTSLSFSQPIWTGGRVASAVTASQADILAGRETLRRVESQVMAAVIQAYVDVRRDQDSVRIRAENVQVLQRQVEESKARFDVGEITRTDVAQSQSRLSAAQALYQSAVAQLGVSRANYAATVGQNPGELEPQPSLAYLLPSDIDSAFAVAEQNNPVLRSQQFAEQASRARVSGARAERMPTLSLRATAAFSGPGRSINTDLYSRNIQGQAVLSVPLFNGGLTTSRIRQQIERNNVDRINIETQRRTVLQNLTQNWNQLVATRANIISTEEAVRAAEIAAEGTRQEQQVGLRTTLEVLNAEQELRNDELAAAAAKHDEYVAATGLLATMGRLEARDLIPAVSQYDPKTNFRRLRITWGWVPWEEPISIVDHTLVVPPIHAVGGKPTEAAIPPGVVPPPAVTKTPGNRGR